jgi:hypothetical protein
LPFPSKPPSPPPITTASSLSLSLSLSPLSISLPPVSLSLSPPSLPRPHQRLPQRLRALLLPLAHPINGLLALLTTPFRALPSACLSFACLRRPPRSPRRPLILAIDRLSPPARSSSAVAAPVPSVTTLSTIPSPFSRGLVSLLVINSRASINSDTCHQHHLRSPHTRLALERLAAVARPPSARARAFAAGQLARDRSWASP